MASTSDWSEFIDNVVNINRNQPEPPSTNGHHPQPDHPLVKTALQKRLAELAATPPGTRNDALNIAAAYLGRFPLDRNELRAMLIDACLTNGVYADDGQAQCDATISSGFKKADLDGPRQIEDRAPHCQVTEIGDHDTTPAAAPTEMSDILHLEADFWERTSLKTIYDTALGRMCPPWAVLANCAARALTGILPGIRLPPLIGKPGSLNWFAAVACRSSLGKSTSSGVARELLPGHLEERNPGSGEGMIGAFRRPATKTRPPVEHDAIMFNCEEIDILTSLGQRSGQTTMSVLRSAFNAERLGFSYITLGRDIHIDTDEYRMTLVLSAQPGRCAALLEDHYGGTPQRFQWFPGNDPRCLQANATPDKFIDPLDIPPPGEWQYPRTLTVPQTVVDTVLAERERNCRGEMGALDGHSLFVREKFAFALAVLDNRTEMTEDDWRLSGIAADISTATRDWVAGQLVYAQDEEHERIGRGRGVQQLAADDEKSRRGWARTYRRMSNLVLEKLGKTEMTNRELTKAIAFRDRAVLPDVLIQMHAAGLIDKDGKHIYAV